MPEIVEQTFGCDVLHDGGYTLNGFPYVIAFTPLTRDIQRSAQPRTNRTGVSSLQIRV